MKAIFADDVMTAIDRVAEHLPDLRVSTGHCHNHTWLIDTRTTTVYVAGGRPLTEWGRDILEALDALCHYHGIPAHHRRLRLIPGHRHDEPAARTGTS